MQARLFCKTGKLAGKDFLIKKEAVIGKHPTSDCVLDDDIISGQHARIYFEETTGCFFVEDLNSRNGTRLDGSPIKHKEKLGDLHVITFAHKFDFIFQQMKAGGDKTAGKASMKVEAVFDKTTIDDEVFVAPPLLEPTERDKTMFDQNVIAPLIDFGNADDPMRTRIDQDFGPVPALPSEPPLATPPAQLKFQIHVISLNKLIELKDGENIVGRTEECDISLDEHSISRKHAVIRLHAGKVFVKDDGSKNKTYVAGTKIDKETEVAPETMIRFGAVETQLLLK